MIAQLQEGFSDSLMNVSPTLEILFRFYEIIYKLTPTSHIHKEVYSGGVFLSTLACLLTSLSWSLAS